jgi:hypothetical protein
MLDEVEQAKKSGMTAREYALSKGVPSSLTDEEAAFLDNYNVRMLNEGAGENVKFGSDAKSLDKLNRQMNNRGCTNDSIKGTVDDAFTTRKATNRATGNPATVYYNKDGSHVIIDDVTNEVVQVSDKFDPHWRPDPSIVDPYKP